MKACDNQFLGRSETKQDLKDAASRIIVSYDTSLKRFEISFCWPGVVLCLGINFWHSSLEKFIKMRQEFKESGSYCSEDYRLDFSQASRHDN